MAPHAGPIPLERYKKYEKRSPLPVYLLERFATIVGADIEHSHYRRNQLPAIVRLPRASHREHSILCALDVCGRCGQTDAAMPKLATPEGGI